MDDLAVLPDEARKLKESEIHDPTTLIVTDEADRLRMAALEQVRAIFDVGSIGLNPYWHAGAEKAHFPVCAILLARRLRP